MNKKILLVDDDPNVLSGYQRNLRNRFQLDTAQGGEEALAKIQANGPYAVIVADMQMPVMSGLDLLVKSGALAPDTVRMMLTGNADQKTAVDAVNRGHVFRFLNKPCAADSLILNLEAGLTQYALVTAERELLERTLNGTIRLLTEVLSSLYPEAFGRGEKVRDYVREYAQFFKFKQSWELEAAALLAPIGYLTLPASLIQKAHSNQELSPAEQDLLGRFPEMGANLLAHIPRLEPVAAIVRYQRKQYDGQGLPADNVAGEDIPIGARILKVLDDLALLELQTGDKPRALAAMKEQAGAYDPRVLDSAFACFDVYLQQSSAAQPIIRPHSLRELSVGQVLAANVETTDGILVVSAGTELTSIVLQRLRNFAVLNPVKEPIYVRC
jgi:response regulator RpfG family c-di-GMP phosphodiesterase